jgi:predicted Zn-dependent protease
MQELVQNAFSRQVEDQADEFALDLLAAARIKPSHFADFLAALPDTPQQKFFQNNLPYLLDHPTQEKRIAKARRAPFSGAEDSFNIEWKAVREELLKRD